MTSGNWSGYVARNGPYTAVQGTWTVPAITENAVVDVVTWVGIGGSTTKDLIQAGTESRTFSDAPTRYRAWVELLPELMQPVPLPVEPGQSISISITSQGGNQWLVDFTNNSTGQNYKTNQTYISSLSSAEWIVERPNYEGSLVPLSAFGMIGIRDASTTVKGQSVSIAQSQSAPLNMTGSNGQIISRTSQLTSDGRGFDISRSG